MCRKKQSGSVILFSLMMIAIIALLTQQMMRGVWVGSSFIQTMIEREHAEMLALSGINVAIAQLTCDERDKKEESSEEKKAANVKEDKESRGIKKMLGRVLPHLNRWQEFALKEPIDGVDGLMRICITCEEGKININETIDFKKMELKKDYETLFKRLAMPGRIPAGEIGPRILNFFKERQRKIDDISQLRSVPGFDALDIFYKPPELPAKGKKSEPNSDLALQDIFTIWSGTDKVDPLWLSDSMCAMFELRRPHADDAQTRRERFVKFGQEFKKEMAGDWDSNWKILDYLYDQKSKVIPDVKGLFTKQFGPRVYSVLSCGKVGQVEQQLLAVIREEDVKKKGAVKSQGATSNEKKAATGLDQEKEEGKRFRILRIYWL